MNLLDDVAASQPEVLTGPLYAEDEGPPPPFTITYGDRHAGDPSLHHVTVSSLMSRAG